MDALIFARWQFAITTVYHFFFVPLTLGLSVMVAIMETLYVSRKQEVYKRMTKFWGKLFLINFAMGVVTGIVQEFQFGMNWSEYSRFMGDIFGAPLAIEALLAFFLESTFLGVWIFGWDKLSPRMHAAAIWLVALGSNVSAFWILIANSFMHHPVGYIIKNGRAEMANFFQLISNPHIFTQYPHTVLAGFTTASFFVLGISMYHILRKNEIDLYKRSFKMAAIFGTISVALVVAVGHIQGQELVKIQPMKIAALEALWETEDPADLSLVAIIDANNQRNTFEISVPRVLSFMLYNRFNGQVRGIKDLQAEYEKTYGAGDYTPPVLLIFWTFRTMVSAGFLMVLLALYALFLLRAELFKSWPLVIKLLPAKTNPFEHSSFLLKLFPFAIVLPYIANTCGWLLTETGRFPWMVYGLFRIDEGVSPMVTSSMLRITLIGYILVYGLLILVTVYLLSKYAKAGPITVEGEVQPSQNTGDQNPSLLNM
jgi:cytochrome d ubiquinol oxidase subunit I